MEISKPINFCSIKQDIVMWQEFDFTLQYFNQYEYELTTNQDYEFLPWRALTKKVSENKYIGYLPFDWSNGYFTFTISETSQKDSYILFSESAELAVFAANLGKYDTDRLIDRNGLNGKFAMIAREIISDSFYSMDKNELFMYLVAYLPHSIISNFTFDHGYYTLKFTTKDDNDVYTLFDGSVMVVKQGEIL